MLEPTSRYYYLETAFYTNARGQRIAYKRRRFLPQGTGLPLMAEVTVQDGDRLDLITTRTLGVPEQFWRICDANNAMNPFDLADETGRVLRVAQPQFNEQSS